MNYYKNINCIIVRYDLLFYITFDLLKNIQLNIIINIYYLFKIFNLIMKHL